MENTSFTTPLSKRAQLLAMYNENERLCREKERLHITTLSRTQAYQLEKVGKFPTRRKLGNTNAWLLSDLLLWACDQWESAK